MQSFVLSDLIEYSAERRIRKPLLKVPNLVSEIVCYEPGQATPTHHHPVQDEIWLVLEGSGEIWVGEERRAVGPTSMIFIPAGERHGLAATPDSRLVLLFIKGPGGSEAPSVAAASNASGSSSVMRSFVLNDLIEYSAERRVRKPLLKVPNLVSEIVCYEPGQTTPTHHHPVQDEIWLVLEGSGEIWVGEERMAVGPTSMIFIPAGQRHGLAATPDSRLVLLFIKGPGGSEAASVAAGSSATGFASSPAESKLQLVVADVQAEARDVLLVELRARDGAELPAFEPGAHVAVELPNRLVRQYSLTNDWRERDRYVLAIGRSSQSKGGSLFVHQALRRGMTLPTSAPRNGFPLDASAGRFLFLAGGIGITPIVAMIRWCEANGRPWRLAYAVRSAQRAAFLETLEAFGGSIHLHADDRMSGVFDPGPWLSDAPEGEHVYCCGPGPMMAAVKAAAAHRPPDTVHFEYFTAPSDGATALPPAKPFTIELRRTGRSFAVPADKSVLDILELNGIKVVSYCREGTCRTCETTVHEGEIEHRDFTLSQQERETTNKMMICVSRAKSERLVLDL